MKYDLKKIKDQYKKSHPPDFITHLKYVICLANLSNNLGVIHNFGKMGKINENRILEKKLKLVNLIIKNLSAGGKVIKDNPGFAEVCVPWVAVKTYYLIFNIFIILEYLVSGEESYLLNSSHEGLIKKIKLHVKNSEIVFDKKVFNQNIECLNALSFKAISGANLKIANINPNIDINSLYKKLVLYKLEDFQRREKIKDFKHKKDQAKKDKFLKENTVNLIEFFYWYRIKSNYRDLEFLDENIDDYYFVDFYKNYLKITINFYRPFKKIINELSMVRLGKEIL